MELTNLAPGDIKVMNRPKMKNVFSWMFKSLILVLIGLGACVSVKAQKAITRFPANQSRGVNPDTRLILTFPGGFKLHNKGQIRIYDASNDELVDMLDMSIPPGPRNTRTPAPYDSMVYNSYGDKMYSVKEPDTSSAHVYQ